MTAWRTWLADGCCCRRGGRGDGFFDEGLLHADAHVAEHELEQVFGFERRGAAEQAFDQRGAGGGGAGDGDGGEGFGDVGEGERRGMSSAAQSSRSKAAAPRSPWRR